MWNNPIKKSFKEFLCFLKLNKYAKQSAYSVFILEIQELLGSCNQRSLLNLHQHASNWGILLICSRDMTNLKILQSND